MAIYVHQGDMKSQFHQILKYQNFWTSIFCYIICPNLFCIENLFRAKFLELNHLVSKLFGTNQILDPKFCGAKFLSNLKRFGPKIFWTKVKFWTQNLFGLNIFWARNFMDSKIIWTKKLLAKNLLELKLFWSQNFPGTYFFFGVNF